MSTTIRNLFSFETIQIDHRKHLRFAITSLATLALAALILWGLVSYSDPHATIHHFALRQINETHSTVNITTHITNKNFFRGFNYTSEGFIDLFYVPNNSFISEFSVNEAYSRELSYRYINPVYQGFRNSTLNWEFELDKVSSRRMNFTILKANGSHFYVSLYMAYYYNILFWTTNAVYYQWLDANVYVDYDQALDEYMLLNNPIHFKRTQDFNWAIST